MKNYTIEYTKSDNTETSYRENVTAADYTDAYLTFIYAHPIHYIIIEMLEA